jgi:hypothetical protein
VLRFGALDGGDGVRVGAGTPPVGGGGGLVADGAGQVAGDHTITGPNGPKISTLLLSDRQRARTWPRPSHAE